MEETLASSGMKQHSVSLSQSFRHGCRNYYFRKLARYLQPREYQRVQRLRSRAGPQITIPELLYLRWGIRKFRPRVIVEIGSFNGASTSLMTDQLQQLGVGKLYAIDFFAQSTEGKGHGGEYWEVFDQTMQPFLGWFEKVEGDSKTVPWHRPIDFLFIDGDHSEAGVSADIHKYTPFVKVGGCVFLHDYLDNPQRTNLVKTVVDRTLRCDPAYRLLGQVSSLVAFQKLRS